MPSIENLHMTHLGGRRVRIEYQIRWEEIERTVNYQVRYEFWEKDSAGRGTDDFLNVVRPVPIAVPSSGRREKLQSVEILLEGDDNWDNEWGKDEIYCIVRLRPLPTVVVPGSVTAESNVISAGH